MEFGSLRVCEWELSDTTHTVHWRIYVFLGLSGCFSWVFPYVLPYLSPRLYSALLTLWITALNEITTVLGHWVDHEGIIRGNGTNRQESYPGRQWPSSLERHMDV
jgi:hypothetical protein